MFTVCLMCLYSFTRSRWRL